MTRAAIVSVGNELLLGETVDTNAAWLGRTLAVRGIEVVWRHTVGDVADDIRDALVDAMARADLVLITGGLGPTPDDRTKAAVADLLELDLVADEAVRSDVARRFGTSDTDLIPPLGRSQYMVPEGARVLRNPVGTAPGLLVEADGVCVAMLPGVPSELKAIVVGDFASVLDDLAGGPIHHRVVHTTGIAESRLAELLESAIRELSPTVRDGVRLAYLPDRLGVDLRLTVGGGTAADASGRFEEWLAGVGEVLDPWRFDSGEGDIAEALVRTLTREGRTIAVAESCTGGLLGARLTAVPGASRVFLGGVIAYSNEAKARHVGVSPVELDRDGAVSEVVARRLAAGIADRFGADVGVGVTGVAGPGGGSAEKPVGTVWIGVSIDEEVEAFLMTEPGDRAMIRDRAAQAALAHVFRRLHARGGG